VFSLYAAFPWIRFVTDICHLVINATSWERCILRTKDTCPLPTDSREMWLKKPEINYNVISYNICISADPKMDRSKASTELNVVLCFFAYIIFISSFYQQM
jgi:hypothetical protein